MTISVRKIGDYKVHQAPNGAEYKRISLGNPINNYGNIDHIVVPPGCPTRPCSHQYTDRHFHVISGSGHIWSDGRDIPIKESDTVHIHAGTQYSLKAGDKELTVLFFSTHVGDDYTLAVKTKKPRRGKKDFGESV